MTEEVGIKNHQADKDHQGESWLPEPIPAESFSNGEDWVNINRSPHDRVSGVVFKRAAAIKRVLYEPASAPQPAEGWQGQGQAVVRWLFSEAPGTEEGLLPDCGFRYLQELSLSPGANTGQRSHPGQGTIVYVIEGRGVLNHRPTVGSPVVVRPLRSGDAALVEGSEFFSLENVDAATPLRMILLGLVTHG